MKLKLRKYPYPFKGLIALSNDIDNADFYSFLEMHRFLNSSSETLLGEGLNLDIGDSFWFFSCKPKIYDGFSYFDGLSTTPSKYSDAIECLVEAGYLDTLHTWGNFSEKGGFDRSYAEKALKCMSTWKRRPIVWMDHGDEMNLQNFGLGKADRADAQEYHADICEEAGFSFYWRNKDTSPLWGADRKVTPHERIMAESGLSSMARLKGILRSAWKAPVGFPVLQMERLQNGKRVSFFSRYLCTWKRTGSDVLEEALDPRKLDFLTSRECCACVLLHFAFGPKFPQFTPETLGNLRELKRREIRGEIGVFSTERLLTYLFVRDRIVWETKELPNGEIRIILTFEEELPHGLRERGAEILNGLSFQWIGSDPSRVRFEYNQSSLPAVLHGDVEPWFKIETWKRPVFPYEEIKKLLRKGE